MFRFRPTVRGEEPLALPVVGFKTTDGYKWHAISQQRLISFRIELRGGKSVNKIKL